ncbi:MAG: Crp/Fnr family transcriptional regulator [Pseudomonadota bacterium]
MDTPCADCPLRKTGAFSPNSTEEIAFVQSFKRGEVLIKAGNLLVRESVISGELYTLLRGWAFRYRTLGNGKRQILNFLLPGDFVGLQERLGTHSSSGVEALTDAVFCRFSSERLWDLYRNHPALGYDITWIAAHEELIVDENLVSVGQRSAAQRIAMLIIHLFKRAESIGLQDADGSMQFPITQQHMADALGLSLVHTNKTLAQLTRHGMFRIKNGRLLIGKPALLNRLADYFSVPLRGRPLI